VDGADELAHLLGRLREVATPRAARVVVDTVVKGKTLDAVGRRLKVTRERVRQIRDKALLRLREELEGVL
jgi:DNA-directed RNA polymerase sigma subunit (sigma70/sigma32)